MGAFPNSALFDCFKVGKTYELLNCDKHKSLLLRNGRDPGGVRPDITHQVFYAGLSPALWPTSVPEI